MENIIDSYNDKRFLARLVQPSTAKFKLLGAENLSLK